MAETPADVTITAVVGEKIILNGSGYGMGEEYVPQYTWTLISPAGVTAVLTNADKVSPSFVGEIAGDYVASLLTCEGLAKVLITITDPI